MIDVSTTNTSNYTSEPEPVLLTEADVRHAHATIGARLYYLNREIDDVLSGALILQGLNGPLMPVEAARELIRRFSAFIESIVADLNAKGIDPAGPTPPEMDRAIV